MTNFQEVLAAANARFDAVGPIAATVLPSRKSRLVETLRLMSRSSISAWKWLERKRTQQIASKRLRVAETVQFGDKRFVSILQVDGTQFLIGGAAGNIQLLAILDNTEDVQSVLRQGPGISGVS